MIPFVTDPDTASVKVVDTDNAEIAPISGCNGKTFQLANGMEYDKVWKVISELMETLQVINSRLYAGVIKKAKGITKKRAAPLLVLPFFFIAISKVLLFRFALFGFPFQIWIFCFRLLQSAF